MRLTSACIPCFFKQALIVANAVNADESSRMKLMKDVAGVLAERMDESLSPAQLAGFVHSSVNSFFSTPDPFEKAKRISNEKILTLEPDFRRMIGTATDPLEMATRLAIIGNLIDFSLYENVDLDAIKDATDRFEPAIYDYSPYRQALEKADHILIITDNAGEVVFDRFLAEIISRRGKKVIVASKEKPILNDATVSEVKALGFEEYSRVIGVGDGDVGTASQPKGSLFAQAFDSADVVISKGQANFETLVDSNRQVFFLFVAKCAPVANFLRVKEGSPILMKGGSA